MKKENFTKARIIVEKIDELQVSINAMTNGSSNVRLGSSGNTRMTIGVDESSEHPLAPFAIALRDMAVKYLQQKIKKLETELAEL